MPDNIYHKKMEGKNRTQLLRVINNQHQFRPEAVEAAKDVLAKRKKEGYPRTSKVKSDFRDDINYRENLCFEVFSNNNTSDLDKNEFWRKFLNQDHGDVLILSDNQYELQIARAGWGDKYLKYSDKTKNSSFIARLDELSKDFTRKVVIAFLENQDGWQSKLEWDYVSKSSSIFSIKKLGYYFLLILAGFFIYFRLNDDYYSKKIVDFLQARDINVMLTMAVFMGLLLISDRYEIKNFRKIGLQSKWWIGMEVFALLMFILFYFLIP